MKIFNYIAAASLAVGCAGLAGCKDDGKPVEQKAADAKDAVVAKVTPSGADKLEGMRETIKDIVSNALDAGNFKTMTNSLTKVDKERLEKESPNANPDMDAEIKKFKDAWKAKYNNDVFSSFDKDKVFGPDFLALGGDAATGGTATIAESHGMPKLEMKFKAENGMWKYDVNDEVSTAMVRENLLKAVRTLNEKQAEWPGDVGTANRVAAHAIMAALSAK